LDQSKKECILVAAARAFARFGLKKASVEEIAKEAGVAKGTIYLAAESKEDLFYQALHREVRAWTGELSKLVDPRRNADDLLREIALAGLQYMNDRPLVRDLLYGTHHLMMPEWVDRLDELRALGRANLLEILRLGVKQGRFRAELDVDEVAKILQDVALSTYLVPDRGDQRDERIAKRLLAAHDLIMHGLLSPSVAAHEPTHRERARAHGRKHETAV
jgi:AcrR family transcriptional regulator